jgi:serine/threonine protein kinase
VFEEKLFIIYKLASTLYNIHENNLIHGHLNPNNIFIE